MANAVIAIPRTGENEIYSSLSAAARAFGLTNQVLATLIESGAERKIKGKYYCFDFACDEEPDEIPEKKAKYPVKYELTSVKSDKVYKFTAYTDMANFCGRSKYYIEKVFAEKKEFCTARNGDVFKLRVLA